ncbi:MAG: thiamine pyrophosphate-binding protein [Thermoprotei archaeon]
MKSENARYEQFEAKTGGHWFAELLRRSGVQFVFGTTGAGMPDIQDAMVVVKPPKWVQGLHEFVSVSAAMGYALASGKPGVALIDRVVGTQNAVGAFYAAYMNMAPVVVFASANIPGVQIPTGGLEYHYSSYQTLIVSPWVKWFTQVESLDTMPEDVEKAFYLAATEPKGPVYVTLRQDLMASRVSKGWVAHSSNTSPTGRVPDDGVLEGIADMLLSASAPAIVVSHSGRNPGAVPLTVELAHLLGAPVIERRVYMSYPTDDPLHLGFSDPYQQPVLPAGTDVALFLETGLLPHLKPNANIDIIDITSDPYHRQDVFGGGDYGSTLFRAKFRVVCDTEPTLRRLISKVRARLRGRELEAAGDRVSRFSEEHTRLFGEWRRRAQRAYDEGMLDPWSIGLCITKTWRNGLVWVNGTLSAREPLWRTVALNEPGTYFDNPSSHLGVTPGAAYGVSLAGRSYVDVTLKDGYASGRISPGGRVVVCTLGDGEAMFGNIGSALWTCEHYGLGVVYVVLNNASWGIEWPALERTTKQWAKKAHDFEFVDIDEPRIDFTALATATKTYSVKVRDPVQLEQELAKCINLAEQGRPSLIEAEMEKYTGPHKSAVS